MYEILFFRIHVRNIGAGAKHSPTVIKFQVQSWVQTVFKVPIGALLLVCWNDHPQLLSSADLRDNNEDKKDK